MKLICLLLISFFVGTVIFEHHATINNIYYKPSLFLNKISDICIDGFSTIGKYIAKISSFYTYIDLRGYYETTCILLEPTISIIMSPLRIIQGYAIQACSYGSKGLIILGTITLVCIICYLVKLYCNKRGIELNIEKTLTQWIRTNFVFGIIFNMCLIVLIFKMAYMIASIIVH